MTEKVMDSSAVLASLHGEPGGDFVRSELSDAFITAINFAEVVSKLIARGMPERSAMLAVARFGTRCVAMEQDHADIAGAIHANTRRAGISMAAAFCLALAKERGWPVLTSDRRWKELNVGVDVTLIR
jgi:ribonuclease VapC